MKPCPHLPHVESRLGPEVTRRHGENRGRAFYFDALRYAQSQWLAGKPAQAILQLNKAFSADLSVDDKILNEWPWPYSALEWILRESVSSQIGFLGNPVRHFQHLASRMSGPRKELRSERAWICFQVAKEVLGEMPGAFPPDGRQMVREGLFFPRARNRQL